MNAVGFAGALAATAAGLADWMDIDPPRYADRMHPELSGLLRSYSIFMGRVW